MLGRMMALGLAHGRVMLVDEVTGELRWEVQTGSTLFALCAMPPSGRFVVSVFLAKIRPFRKVL